MEKEIPPNAATPAHFNLLRAWCNELGQDWDEVMKRAGSEDSGRTTKNRMVQGTASLGLAIKIGKALQAIQQETGKVAVVGPQALLLREWADLGARLALANPAEFADVFSKVRGIVLGEEARTTGPFTRAGK